VDIGASIGYFSILAARKVGAQGKVYAFEPHPESFARLVRNLGINGFNNVVASPVAVGNHERNQTLYLSDDESTSTLLGPTAETSRRVLVPVRHLDRELRNEFVDVIKVDTEGYEMEVIPTLFEFAHRNPAMMLICEYNQTILEKRRSESLEFFELLRSQWPLVFEVLESPIGSLLRGPLRSPSQISRRTCNLLSTTRFPLFVPTNPSA
jgi:FkbM family methyltransferase